jgi:hypothetical protein
MAGGGHTLTENLRLRAARSGIAPVARACDQKQTDSRSPDPGPKCRRLLPVFSFSGEHLYFAGDDEARELLRSQKARILTTRKGRARALQLIASGAVRPPRPARYSHDRETSDNVRGCWTLIRIPNEDRRIYRAVVDDCLAD